ncbi:MAG: hypothetical protein E7212_00700 [Clostridium sartagoforme]|nr:hypothetical protein [Clostridium sartagoforme]
MLEKLILSDQDFDYLAKGIALGAGIGIIIGVFIDNIILAFSTCTALGITFSLMISLYKKIKHK